MRPIAKSDTGQNYETKNLVAQSQKALYQDLTIIQTAHGRQFKAGAYMELE